MARVEVLKRFDLLEEDEVIEEKDNTIEFKVAKELFIEEAINHTGKAQKQGTSGKRMSSKRSLDTILF